MEEKLNKGKIVYENIKTGEEKETPTITYDTMYQPIGDGTDGIGPTRVKDEDGSIIMSSIRGVKTERSRSIS